MVGKHNNFVITFGLVLIFALCLSSVLAQPGPTPGYSVLGKVTNADGTDASGASIVVTHVPTQATYSATTNTTGWYVVYNIEADVGDQVRVEASLAGSTGQGTATISETSPLYEVDITLEENESGFSPPLWLLLVAAIVIVVFLVYLFLRGGTKTEAPPKRRRK